MVESRFFVVTTKIFFNWCVRTILLKIVSHGEVLGMISIFVPIYLFFPFLLFLLLLDWFLHLFYFCCLLFCTLLFFWNRFSASFSSDYWFYFVSLFSFRSEVWKYTSCNFLRIFHVCVKNYCCPKKTYIRDFHTLLYCYQLTAAIILFLQIFISFKKIMTQGI